MKKPNVNKIVQDARKALDKNSPQILTGIGIAGMVTTTVLAVKATPKALELIRDAEIEKMDKQVEEGKDPDEICEKLTAFETIKVAWKPYIPVVLTGGLSAACLIGANSIHTRRTAALATAYKISETALTEYREKVVETIGEKKEKAVRDKVAKEKVEKNPVSTTEVFITEKGNTLCYDAISGRYFKSDIEQIKRAVNYLNKRMLSEMYISLSEFYNEIGLAHTNISDELGWNINDGLIEVDFSSQIAEDGTPCIVIDYYIAPRYDFSKLM